MTTYASEIRVTEDDLDDMQHVNNVRYVQWIQDISREHWESAAPASLRDGLVWVVLNHNITYRNPAVLGDIISIKTHIAEIHGATSSRVVEMINKANGAILVTSRTLWCLLSAGSLRPKRISDEIGAVFQVSESQTPK